MAAAATNCVPYSLQQTLCLIIKTRRSKNDKMFHRANVSKPDDSSKRLFVHTTSASECDSVTRPCGDARVRGTLVSRRRSLSIMDPKFEAHAVAGQDFTCTKIQNTAYGQNATAQCQRMQQSIASSFAWRQWPTVCLETKGDNVYEVCPRDQVQ